MKSGVLSRLLMPTCVLVVGALSFVFADQVRLVLSVKCVPFLLGMVMFGMGLTLKGRDFLPVVTHPKEVCVGVVAQFVLMPLLAVVVSKALRLPPDLAFGVVLVGCCPGGTASNVMAYLAGGDVALSVAMTSCSTILAPLLTPLAVFLCAGRGVDVDALALALSVVKVVLLPVTAGVLANEFFPRRFDRVRAAMPAFSSATVVVIVAAVVAASALRVPDAWGAAVLAVVLHNVLGMVAGGVTGRLLGFTPERVRTLAIEVGMQNSGLAVSLHAAHFAMWPMAAVPGAFFSVWHNVSGALYAAWCRSMAR